MECGFSGFGIRASFGIRNSEFGFRVESPDRNILLIAWPAVKFPFCAFSRLFVAVLKQKKSALTSARSVHEFFAVG